MKFIKNLKLTRNEISNLSESQRRLYDFWKLFISKGRYMFFEADPEIPEVHFPLPNPQPLDKYVIQYKYPWICIVLNVSFSKNKVSASVRVDAKQYSHGDSFLRLVCKILDTSHPLFSSKVISRKTYSELCFSDVLFELEKNDSLVRAVKKLATVAYFADLAIESIFEVFPCDS